MYLHVYVSTCVYAHVMWCDVMWCDVVWCDVMWCMHAYIISICIHYIAYVIIYIMCWFTFLFLPSITRNLVHWSDHTKVVVAGLKEGLKLWKSPKRRGSAVFERTRLCIFCRKLCKCKEFNVICIPSVYGIRLRTFQSTNVIHELCDFDEFSGYIPTYGGDYPGHTLDRSRKRLIRRPRMKWVGLKLKTS